MRKIVLLIDYTGVCLLAMEHVALLARKSLCRVILLHIAPKEKENNLKEIKDEIREFSMPLENDGIPYSISVEFGDFFDEISTAVKKLDPDLLIVGTHGIKGIKMNFLSSNILRLLRLIDTPSLIIQGHCETPLEGYLKILVPLIGKPENTDLIGPLTRFGKVFNSEIHFLGYFNEEDEKAVSGKLANYHQSILEGGLKSISDKEKTSVFTGQYARSLIEYSDIEEAQLIVLVLGEKDEDYFSSQDCENILLNRLGKPILCL